MFSSTNSLITTACTILTLPDLSNYYSSCLYTKLAILAIRRPVFSESQLIYSNRPHSCSFPFDCILDKYVQKKNDRKKVYNHVNRSKDTNGTPPNIIFFFLDKVNRQEMLIIVMMESGDKYSVGDLG